MKHRCAWAESDPLMMKYHDNEWGTPLYNDRLLFEFLILDGMQAGLSWLTILRKREAFRKAFDNFDPHKIARYKETKTKKLLQNSGIIRNRLKIQAAVSNAQAYLDLTEESGSFADFIWGFVNGKPIQNAWKNLGEIPAQTDLSAEMSKELKKRGFRFVGPTICYAFMQAAGMVNDHVVGCFRYGAVQKQQRR